ncbi:hypothetical protein [Cohnella nanjingensis]|uniref:Uncharacterized protein n=1 Tax=Cohnella nanjingensis TaxID=1387779 RepID=A0A7X0RTH6_9BACL|nr:hypothetical protein [Cohnella nanjingensis]MBB6673394.1 hypothetical protein [Cohnella nanjingensis]
MDTMAQWNEELQRCKQNLQAKAREERKVRALQEEVRKQEGVVRECRDRFGREEADVDQLKSASVARLWNRLIGRLDERLREEEREAADAWLKYDAAEAALRALEGELAEARRSLGDVIDADLAYERLLSRREAWIREHDLAASAELQRVSESLGELRAMRKELDEAKQAGEKAARALASAEERLRSARNWGTYDMLGGGAIATHIKHNRIDEARAEMHEAQHALRMFEKELNDLRVQAGVPDVEVGGFLTFADYFFDGFLTDWIVQGRIDDALNRVQRGGGEVRRQLDRVAADQAKTAQAIAEQEARYRATLEGGR